MFRFELETCLNEFFSEATWNFCFESWTIWILWCFTGVYKLTCSKNFRFDRGQMTALRELKTNSTELSSLQSKIVLTLRIKTQRRNRLFRNSSREKIFSRFFVLSTENRTEISSTCFFLFQSTNFLQQNCVDRRKRKLENRSNSTNHRRQCFDEKISTSSFDESFSCRGKENFSFSFLNKAPINWECPVTLFELSIGPELR